MTIDNSTEVAAAGSFPSRRFGKRERALLACANEYDVATSTDWDSAPTGITAAVDELASKVRAMECIVATYDFATHGGAQGAKALSVTLPDNFVVTSITAHILTAITDGSSGSPTIQLLAATDDISGLSPSIGESVTAGLCRGLSATAAIHPVVTTGARALNATIATADLTAGKVRWFIWGFQSI